MKVPKGDLGLEGEQQAHGSFVLEIQIHDTTATPQFHRGFVSCKDQLFGATVPVPSAARQHQSVCTHDQQQAHGLVALTKEGSRTRWL